MAIPILTVFSIVVPTIFLRQKGSPESKLVDAPHHETGDWPHAVVAR